MAIEILLPRLGWTMEEGTFVEWLKKDGDAIKPGDVLYTVESDKSLNEVEAFDAGVLRIPASAPAPGAKIPVGTVLAYIMQAGEEIRETPISPRARRVATELSVDWAALKGSGRTGRIVERDIRAAALQTVQPIPTPAVINASPLAARLAVDLGVDLQQLAQAMPGKRIERGDIERAAAIAQPHTTHTPMSGTRRVIAERMASSAHTTAPVTLNTEVDATELVRLREHLKADAAKQNREEQRIPTFNDLLAKISAQALRDHPALNARLDGDAIVQESSAHIGIAVDTERGLLVIVLRDVQDKPLRQIAEESQALIQRARAGTAPPDELRGSTFTITNLGMYEIDSFTPIINLPECAILGIGRIAPKQIVIDVVAEKVAIRHMLTLSLTFDHRLVDGAPASRFLQRIKQLVERPYLWLVQ